MELILRHLWLYKFIKSAYKTIPDTHLFRRNQVLMAAFKIKLILRFTRALKRYRGYKYKQVCKLRNSFSVAAVVLNGEGDGNKYIEAKEIIKRALRAHLLYEQIKQPMRRMFQLVHFMQKKFQGRFIGKAAKADLIDDMWLRLVEELRERALQNKAEAGF